MQQLLELYQHFTAQLPKTVETITASGSNRQYVRFTSSAGESVIGAIGTSEEENRAFVYLARHFLSKGLPVPRVLAVADDGMRYLQEDLGSRSLFDALCIAREEGGHYGPTETDLLRRTVAALPRLQVLGAEGLDFSRCYPQPAMDETNVMFDLNYFKYCFLKTTGADFHELRLEADFRAFARDLTSAAPDEPATFLYRDFQARNVMLDADGNPHFIDFQGGRRGPLFYDLASFLWQAAARYPQSLREELIDVYLQSLNDVAPSIIPALGGNEAFRASLRRFVLFRLLQVLGAYGFRGLFERKQHFIDSIPPALENLRHVLASDDEVCPYSELRKVLSTLASAHASQPQDTAVLPQLQGTAPASQLQGSAPTSSLTGGGAAGREASSPLLVRIFSFSYKLGIPEDPSGNGGGYVFDCRSTHNPGRYEPYKQLTGLDAPVIQFLEHDGEILTFLDSVYLLADAHVERYLQRGFTHLMFSFGCTGGQHRSVYCAQHLAEHLHCKYGIQVDLTHREQGIHSVLPKQCATPSLP